jgi:hypothetical protein
MSEVALVVIAKAPAPGRSKTRLCPPWTPAEAASLAEASLRDTLSAVASAGAGRRLLVLDGEPGGWLPKGFEVRRQRGDGLGERLGNALLSVSGPALVVGMDTPQLTSGILNEAAGRLEEPGVDAVLGPAPDGGYWGIGLREPDARVFEGVPMSSAGTCAAQLDRLGLLGLETAILPALRDVDTHADALAVAAEAPGSRFARELARLSAPAHA